MLWLFAYLGGIICIMLMMLAAAKQNIPINVPANGLILISVLWPIIFTILCFKKFLG